MDRADEADVDAALYQLAGLTTLLRAHVHHENTFVHPAMESRSPCAAFRIALEHEEHWLHPPRLAAHLWTYTTSWDIN